jgi:hypothetical protein
MRVQSDIQDKPEAVYIVHKLYDHDGATLGLAASVGTEDGVSVTPTATSAAWFWPMGVLALVPDGSIRFMQAAKTRELEKTKAELATHKVAVTTIPTRRFSRGFGLSRIMTAASQSVRFGAERA